jgi:hypothetical protein
MCDVPSAASFVVNLLNALLVWLSIIIIIIIIISSSSSSSVGDGGGSSSSSTGILLSALSALTVK